MLKSLGSFPGGNGELWKGGGEGRAIEPDVCLKKLTRGLCRGELKEEVETDENAATSIHHFSGLAFWS